MIKLTKALIGGSAAAAVALSAASPAIARDGGLSAGDIIAGAVVLGGIAAVAGAIGRDRDDGYYYRGSDRDYRGGDRDYRDYRYDRAGYGDPRQAVEQCVRTAEREASRRGYSRADVREIRDVDRKGYGYRVKGSIQVDGGRDYRSGWGGSGYRADDGKFTCDIQNGRVVGLDYSGIRGL